MFVKIATIALTAFIVGSTGGLERGGFVVTWNRNTSGLFNVMPTNSEAAINEGWSNVSGVNQPEGVTALGYQGDPSLVMLYRRSEAVGLQIAIRVSDVNNTGQPANYDANDAFITKTLNGNLYYTVTIYSFDDESTGTRRLQVQEKNGLREIPTNVTQLLAETSYSEKNCIPTMGRHYYAWKSTSDCSNLYPVTLLGDGNEIVGWATQSFGTVTQTGNLTLWENFSSSAIRMAFPDAPECVVTATDTYKIISVHAWFIKRPQAITC